VRALLFFLLVFTVFSARAQKKYTWSEFLKNLSEDTSRFVIQENDGILVDYRKHDKNEPGGVNQFDMIDPAKIIAGRLLVNRSVRIIDPDIKVIDRPIKADALFLPSLHFKKKVRIFLSSNRLNLLIHNCIFEEGLEINAPFGGGKQVWLTSNKVSGQFGLVSEGWDHIVVKGNSFTGLHNLNFNVLNCGQGVEITENSFTSEGALIPFMTYKTSALYFTGNTFSTSLSLYGSVEDFLELRGNSFEKKVVLQGLIFPSHTKIDWDDIKDRLAVFGDSTELYTGISSENLKNKKSYKELIGTYKTLYDVYKSKGDLESSNGCFVAAKDLEGERIKVLYEIEGGFKNYFSWKLNRLMKVYTNHATEPALALVISLYILVGFAVFYFFFPSEWDIESKGKLVQHYKDFVQKNDKGYLKPFLKLTFGFFVSFINALTLSLNAFVTLGFGNIPTKGVAKYICVVQGFIGWFLLSIFTVALFNQVLF